ncbi:MAG: histidine phosphatase family protein, partial [Bryobacteraceae bacterium]
HGQAGTRENYDSLSDLGHRQARAIGEDLARQGIRFERVIAGGLSRQQATAREAMSAFRDATGESTPAIETEPLWNEFDLASVYEGMAPHLSAADPEFKRQYDAMHEAIAASRGAHGAPIHRRWNDCDRAVVTAWVEGRYPFDGETWSAFHARIHEAFSLLTAEMLEEGNVAIFTSATPIGICAAGTFDLHDVRALQFAAVMHNAAITTFRVRANEVRLFSYNLIAHLSDPSMKTFR